MPGRLFAVIGVALIAAMQADDTWARAGRGQSHASHGGHFSRGFGAYRMYAPRRAFIAAPYAYFPSVYYPPPFAFDNYDPYYAPVPPPAYYPPPAPAPRPPLSYYAPPPADRGQAPAPIYTCKDSSGATSITNRKSATVGKVCSELD